MPHTAQAALEIAGAEQTLDRHIAQRSPVRIECARLRGVVDGEPAEHRRAACPIALDGAQHLVANDGDLVITRQLLLAMMRVGMVGPLAFRGKNAMTY